MDSLSMGDLAVALLQLLGGPQDHIIWEIDDNVPSGLPDFSSGLPLDPENGSTEPPEQAGPFLPVAPGDGLPTALGLLEARRLLATDSWIAVVLREANLQTALSPETIQQLAKVNRRFLLVVLQDNPSGANTVPQPCTHATNSLSSIPALRDLGWDCTIPAEQTRPDDLAEQLEFIRRENAPAVLFVQGALSPAAAPSGNGQPFHGGHGTVTDRSSQSDRKPLAPQRVGARDFVDRELIELARVDSRLLLITEPDLAGLLEFPAVLPDQYQAVDHFDGALSAWCRGITAGGGRPVIWLAGGNGNGTFNDAWRNRPGLPLTFLLGGTGEPADAEEPQGFDAPSGPSVITPNDAAGIRRALRSALRHSESRIVVLPDRIPLTPEPPPRRAASPPPKFSRNPPANLPQAPPYGMSAALLQHERRQVLATRLSPDVDAWSKLYSQVGHRQGYLWQWCIVGTAITTLPCVPAEWIEHLRDTKVLSIMICVLLDDVADVQGRRDFLEALLRVVSLQERPDLSRFSKHDRQYADVVFRLSRIYEERVREYPFYEVYKDLLHYDLMQFCNTLKYSCLVNQQLFLLNLAEHELYLPHNMHMMSFATLDLMCTPNFEVNELGGLREAVWHAQCMGRIGNLLGTWRREMDQGDFTGGVFARAVGEGDLTVDELSTGSAREIEAIISRNGHEEHFFQRWHWHRNEFLARADRLRSVDLRKIIGGHERFFRMHLASRGLI